MRGKVLETNGNVPSAKIRTSVDIFKNEKCKVTFGLEYIYLKHLLYLMTCWWYKVHFCNFYDILSVMISVTLGQTTHA